MLGEKIGQEEGKVTGRRILPGDDYRYVKMEITIETEATILGVKGTNMGTYTVFERVPGQIYGQGQGIFMSSDGAGAIWNGLGVGQANEDGSIAFASAIAFQTDAPALSRLNGILTVAEHTTSMDNVARSSFYAWTA